MAWIGARSDKGRVRQTNQDACCVEVAQTALGEAVMAVVCDGVGGLSQGEVASATVVENFSLWFGKVLPSLVGDAAGRGSTLSAATIRESWSALIAQLNEALFALDVQARVGTTMSAVLCLAGRYVVAHVGDTRVYRMGGGGITQVTEDQTLINQRLAEGTMSEEEALASGQGHVITQAIGAYETIRPSFYSGRTRGEDLFVVCSDGAWHCMGEEGIQDVFDEADWHSDEALAQACDLLVQQDMALGESDNLTVACFCPTVEAGPSSQGQPLPHGTNDITLVGVAPAEPKKDGEADS